MLFADTGLSTSQISSLFVIWSVTSLLLEVPSGALADLISRQRLLTLGALVYGSVFAVWVAWPSYLAFALGSRWLALTGLVLVLAAMLLPVAGACRRWLAR